MKTQSWKSRTLFAGGLLLALAATPLVRADYQSTVLSQGPVGYWRLNETVQPQPASPAVNLGSLGATGNGTYNGLPTRGLPGPFAGSSAVGLDGSVQYVATPYNPALNTSSFSVEVWANPAQVPKFAYLASSVHLTAPRSGWYLAQDDGTTFGVGNGFVVRMFYTNAATPSITLFATNDLALGSWYHLVLTFDGTTATLYKNGVAVDSGSPLANGAGLRFVPNIDAQTTFGERSDNNFRWPGQIAEVAMYGSVLSGARVSAHYTTPGPATVQADSPALYWRFTEAADPVAANLGTSGSSKNALYFYDARAGVNGPATGLPGFEAGNKATAFSGPGGSGAVQIPPLNLNTNTVTISAWVNATNVQAIAAGLVICHGGTTVSGLTMDTQGSNLGLGYIWNGNNYGWSPSGDSGLPQLPDSGWAYVALVIQPTQGALFICDGANYLNFSSVTNSFSVTHANQAFDGGTLIGAEAGQLAGGRNFYGAIDEVAIWNRALGSGELYSQYAAAVGGVPPKLFADLQGPTDPIAAGDPVVLTVDGGGTPPLTYYWHKNGGGTAYATTTNGVLTIANSTVLDSGAYDVTISNLTGIVPSQQVSVTVITPTAPSIVGTEGFNNRTIYPTATLRLAVSATGGGLKYQWYKNSSPIGSATGSSYTIPSVVSGDAGNYSVSVTNTVNTATNGPVTIAVSTPAPGSYGALMVTAAPEAWWRLNEAAGSTNLVDGMGRHDGLYTNLNSTVPPVVLGVPGALSNDPDTAATFSAGGLGVVSYSANLNNNQFSVEGWVKTSITSGSLVPFSSSFGAAGWWCESIGGWWNGNTSSGSFGNNNNVNTAAQIVPGQWSHVVITYDGTRIIGGTHYPFILFVNGQTDGFVWGGPASLNGSGPFVLGGRGVSLSTLADRLFDGQVDEVAVYKRLLSQTEIQSHFQGRFGSTTPPYFVGSFSPQTVTPGKSLSYNTAVYGSIPIVLQWYKDGVKINGSNTPSLTLNNVALSDTGTYTLGAGNSAGTNTQSVIVTVIPATAYANVTNDLVLHLRFDGNTSDTSGHGNNGTPVGSPSFVPGLIGPQALQYSTAIDTNVTISVTSSSYVNLGNPADLSFGLGSFSVGLWVKFPTGATPGDLPFIGICTNSMNNPGWALGPTYGDGGWQWCLNDGVNNLDVSGPGGSLNDGNWHNFALTVDRSGDVVSSYVDGVLTATRDITSLGSVDNNNFWPVTIGQDPTGLYPVIAAPSANDLAAWGVTVTNTLDDIGIWHRALTAMEVAQIESAGKTGGHSFDTVSPNVTITVTRNGSSLTLGWPSGTLLESTSLDAGASWTPVAGATAPSYTFTLPSTGNKYYKVQQ